MGNTDVKPVLFVPFGGEGGEGGEESGPAWTIGSLGQPGLLGVWASGDYWECAGRRKPEWGGGRVGNWGSGLRAFSAEGGEGGCGFAKGAARKTGPQNPRKRRLRRAWIVLNRRTVLELP